MPVSIVPCQARRLQGEHRPSHTLTDRCQQTTESGPFVRSGARSSQIVINDNDFGKAKLSRSFSLPSSFLSTLANSSFHRTRQLSRTDSGNLGQSSSSSNGSLRCLVAGFSWLCILTSSCGFCTIKRRVGCR